MGNKGWFVDSGIIAQEYQDFEETRYFQSMWLHKEAFETTGQTNVESVTENFEKIGAVVSVKVIKLQKSPSPALVEEKFKTGGFQRHQATYCINNCY